MKHWQGKPRLKGLGISAGVLLAILWTIWLIGNFSPLQRYTRKGDEALAEGNYGLALEEYNLALKASPDNWDVEVKIAKVMLAQKDWSEADKLLSSLLARDAGRGKSLYPLLVQSKLALAQAEIAKQPQGSDLARMYLEDALKYGPDNPHVTQLLAEQLYDTVLGMPADLSIQTLQKIIQLDPQATYKLELASRYLRLNKTKEFEQTVGSFTPQDLAVDGITPALAQYFLNYARSYDQKLTEKKRILAEGLKVLPGDPHLLLEQLRCLQDAGDKQGYGELLADPSLEDWKRQLLQNYLAALQSNAFVESEKVYQVKTPPLRDVRMFRTNTGPVLAGIEYASGSPRLITLDVDSGRQQVLTKAGNELITTFALSLNGAAAYQIDEYPGWNGPENGGKLILHTAQGDEVLQQETAGHQYYEPVFSPDGRFLAYHTAESVMLLNLATGLRLQVGNRDETFAGWAPDSSRFLLVTNQDRLGEPWTLARVMDVKGKTLTSIPAQQEITYQGWRPDGELTASRSQVTRQSAFPAKQQLFTVDEQSGQFTPLPDDVLFPQSFSLWSPDGNINAVLGDANVLWLYRKGEQVPCPIIYPGQFMGWSGPDRLLFAVTPKGTLGFGDAGPVPLEKVVELTVGGK